MAPRGEVAMIVALIGRKAGIIGQGIYVTLVLMSLLTTIITPSCTGTGFIAGSSTATIQNGMCIDEGK
jgi:Kef-type K+ transport system membrane component KefB